MNIAMVACPAWAVWAPNPALLHLSAQLERDGHQTELFDLNIEAYHDLPGCQELWLDSNSIKWETKEVVEQLFREHRPVFAGYVERIARSAPDIVCFTVNSGARFVFPLFARLLRELLPDVFFIVGGPDCFRSEYFDQHMIPWVIDALCMGEGDLCLPEIINRIKQAGGLPKEQAGFLFWDGDKIRDNGDPQRPADLDALAPVTLAKTDLSRYTLPNRVTISISRGCINRCAFCSESPNFGRFRTHSAEWMAGQVEALLPALAANGNTPHINFNDSLINGNIQVLERLCDLIIKRDMKFTWGGMAYIREEMTLELMGKMRKAGCVEICWGIESGSATVLKGMRKRFTPTLLDRVIGDAAQLGIAQYGNLIVGFPGEGPREFAESLLFLVKNVDKLTSVGLPLFTPRKNSPIYADPAKFGLADVDYRHWTTLDGRNSLKIRMLRREILSQVLQAKKFDQGRYNAIQEENSIDLKDPESKREYTEIFAWFTEIARSYLSREPHRLPLLETRLEEPRETDCPAGGSKSCGLDSVADAGKRPASHPTEERLWRKPPAELDEIKKQNYYRYVSSRIERRTEVLNTPLEIFLETANSCNLNCVFCAIRGKTPRPSGPSSIMQPDVMGKVEPFLPGMASISLHGFGEPLLNRYLIPAASEAMDYKAQVDFFTNGMLLSEQNIKALVYKQVPYFTISISTADPVQYESLYERGKFERLSRNLRMLLEEKERQGKQLPHVTFNTIAMRDTLPRLPELVLFAAEHGVKSIELKPLVVYDSMPEMNVQRIIYDAGRDRPVLDKAQELAERCDIRLSTWIYEDTGREENCNKTLQARIPQQWSADKPCPLVFRTMYVRVDGQVKPCCFYANTNDWFLGDLTKQSAEEIWNGENFRELRQQHLDGKIPPGCAHCFKFRLAPPSDSSRAWLDNSGIAVYDPFPVIEQFSYVSGNLTVARRRLDTLSNGVPTALPGALKAGIELLRSLSGMAREFQPAKASLPELSQTAQNAIEICQSLSTTLQPFMNNNHTESDIRQLHERLNPTLNMLPEMLQIWQQTLMTAVNKAA
jgi:anaerobic magnesium-protoporphyrin IX monomethyl ester cyclase